MYYFFKFIFINKLWQQRSNNVLLHITESLLLLVKHKNKEKKVKLRLRLLKSVDYKRLK